MLSRNQTPANYHVCRYVTIQRTTVHQHGGKQSRYFQRKSAIADLGPRTPNCIREHRICHLFDGQATGIIPFFCDFFVNSFRTRLSGR